MCRRNADGERGGLAVAPPTRSEGVREHGRVAGVTDEMQEFVRADPPPRRVAAERRRQERRREEHDCADGDGRPPGTGASLVHGAGYGSRLL